MSNIYGIWAGAHNASVSYINNGDIIYAIEEERLSRIKSGNDLYRTPRLALDSIEKLTKTTAKYSDCVMWPLPKHEDMAMEVGGEQETLSHHYSHAYGAYLTSGFKDKCLIISMDAGGTTCYGRYFVSDGDDIKEFHKSCGGSAGQYYVWLTEGLGWQMLKDEGKVTGMASHGHYDEKIYSIFKQSLFNDGMDFSPKHTGPLVRFICQHLDKNGKWMTDPEKRKVVAYNAQIVFEEAIIGIIEHIHKIYPDYKKVILVGGIFGNVRLNKAINDIKWVEEVYVYPPMGDQGLSLGSALYKSKKMGEVETRRVKNLFWGLRYSNEDVVNSSKKFENLICRKFDVKEAAQLIDSGNVVGWFQGGFEFGPRSLGARSILVKPTDKDTNDKLNSRLSRNDIMPFAPAVLDEYANDIFDIKKSRYTAEFMTMCYDTKKEWIDSIPAVIHPVDKTARPQIVVKENNPLFYDIINEYRKVSNIPVVLNTSFNAHGEPIINSPENAMKRLDEGMIDYLIIEDYICQKK